MEIPPLNDATPCLEEPQLHDETEATWPVTESGISQRDSALSRLPAELRNQIYRYVLVSPDPITIPQNGRLPTPGLLLACRQIRRETAEIYWAENVFYAVVTDSMPIGPVIWLEKHEGAGKYIDRLVIKYWVRDEFQPGQKDPKFAVDAHHMDALLLEGGTLQRQGHGIEHIQKQLQPQMIYLLKTYLERWATLVVHLWAAGVRFEVIQRRAPDIDKSAAEKPYLDEWDKLWEKIRKNMKWQ